MNKFFFNSECDEIVSVNNLIQISKSVHLDTVLLKEEMYINFVFSGGSSGFKIKSNFEYNQECCRHFFSILKNFLSDDDLKMFDIRKELNYVSSMQDQF